MMKKVFSKLNMASSAMSTKSTSNPNLKTGKKLGRSLFVGEGNLTYIWEMLRQGHVVPKDVVATLFESEELASKTGVKSTAENLISKHNVKIIYEVDATRLASHPFIKERRFDHIQFNYPHHVSAPSTLFQPHRELITGFFKQAKLVLDKDGIVRVLLPTSYPFGAAAGVDVASDDDVAAEDVAVVGSEDNVTAGGSDEVADDGRGWNIMKLAKEAGLMPLETMKFDMREHELYKPIKGFGKNPNTEFKPGKSLYYDFQIDWTNAINSIPKREDGKALLAKYDAKPNPKKKN